jgi:hypothetical protein
MSAQDDLFKDLANLLRLTSELVGALPSGVLKQRLQALRLKLHNLAAAQFLVGQFVPLAQTIADRVDGSPLARDLRMDARVAEMWAENQYLALDKTEYAEQVILPFRKAS